MTNSRPAVSPDKIMLRLPDGLRDRLNELARVNGRSANAEAVQALQAWLLPEHQTESAFVRLTDELWHKVSRAAQKNKRGVVEEIMDRLTRTLSEDAPMSLLENGPDIRTEIRNAIFDAVEALISDPGKLKLLTENLSPTEGREPASG
jgi:plasmid stability protein